MTVSVNISFAFASAHFFLVPEINPIPTTFQIFYAASAILTPDMLFMFL